MMRYLAVVLVFALAIGALAQSAPSVPASGSTQLSWLVEFNTPPTADGGTASAVQKDKTSFRNAAAAAKIGYTEKRSFDTLWNGMAIRATAKDAATLANLPGVKAIYPDVQVTYDPGKGTNELDLATAIAMTGADVAQNSLGLTGKGVKVAVIDTGIDYEHPDLGGCFGDGCRVVKGYDFVGDAYNANDDVPVITPDNDPMDCAGHGTHVSGIIGANGAVTGVAPGVTFYAYRVFGCVGSTSSEIMLAAMERALSDGAQVVNMSIGSAYTWPQYPTATASDRLVKKGVVVVASFGNSGPGLYSGGAPGVGQDVIGVASFDNTHTPYGVFTISPDNAQIKFVTGSGGAVGPPLSGSPTLAKTGTTTTANDGCAALPAGSMAGKVVLIRRGTCSFYIKAINAENAGAAGVILYNNQTGYISPSLTPSPTTAPLVNIPVVSISAADGATIDSRIAANPTTMTWTSNVVEDANSTTGGIVSSFSSMGLSPDLALKPDIGAPGGSIRSTYPVKLGSYAVLSGTSMASPHVAGAVALLLEANPKLQARRVRDILQNTAIPAPTAPGGATLDGVWNQGAGLLNIPDAVLATTRITPGKLSLGESAAGPATRALTFSNNSDHDITYTLSFVDGQLVSNTFTAVREDGGSNVVFSANPLLVPAGSEVTVSATITAPTTPAKGIYGGWIVATPNGGGQKLRVPFAGFIGDYQSIQAMAPTPYGFPWLVQLSGGSYLKLADGTSFTLAKGNIPYVLLHLDQQVAQLQLQVTDALSGRNWQFVDNEKYVVRNSTATGYFAIPVDGTTYNPGNKSFTLPNGNYTITVRALKALGNPDNPADWETWTSPVFTIQRPN